MFALPRSLLFVSGEKAGRFAKAFAAGADLVCIDLEDTVQPASKDAARASVLEFLGKAPRDPADLASGSAVRINPIEWARRTLSAASATAAGAFLVDGELVDAAIVKRAERIVALATRSARGA